jgi:hypothetical protein
MKITFFTLIIITFILQPIASSRNLSHSASSAVNNISTPAASSLKPTASCSTSRRNRLSLDPNWKENLKRRRILLNAEFNDPKIADTCSPAKRSKTIEEHPGTSVSSLSKSDPSPEIDHQKQILTDDIAIVKNSVQAEPISKCIEIEKNQPKSESPNDTIRARIEKKKLQLQRELSHKSYVDSLTDNIEQWKAGCIAALEDLSSGSSNGTSIGELMKIFSIPPELLGYDVDGETYYE